MVTMIPSGETEVQPKDNAGWTSADVAEIVIDARRYPSLPDRILAGWDGDGAVETLMPKACDLKDMGVDIEALAAALRNGLNAKAFGAALNSGLDVRAFNQTLASGRLTVEELNQALEHLGETLELMAIHPNPAGRVLHRLGECSCFGARN